MKPKIPFRDQRGLVYVVALLVLLVLTLIGMGAMTTTTFEAGIAGNERVYNQAFYAADGGIEDFRATAPSNADFMATPAETGTYYPDPKAVGGSTYEITWNKLGLTQRGGIDYKVIQVTSRGNAPSFPMPARVTVESIVEINIPKPGYDN